jgi:hypothetical protein
MILACPHCRLPGEPPFDCVELAELVGGAKPAEGIVHVCAQCGELLVYDVAARCMRKITDDEMSCIPLSILAQIGARQDAIRTRRRALVN